MWESCRPSKARASGEPLWLRTPTRSRSSSGAERSTSTTSTSRQLEETEVIEEPNPIQNEVRRARRVRRLAPGAACCLCGETEPAALRMETVRRSTLRLLDAHHPLGEANDEELVLPLCLNCHAKATAAQQDAG